MNEIDFRQLLLEAKKFFTHEWNYTKLTAVEKLTILLSATAVVAVVVIIGAFALAYLANTLVTLLGQALGSEWGANLLVAALLVVLLLLVIAFKQRIIVDPIARFVTKLFLNAEENE